MKKLLPTSGFVYLLVITLLTGTVNTVSAQCIAPSLTFENPVLTSGTAGEVGATYRFAFVTTNTDAYITIDSIIGGARLVNIDATNTGYGHAWQPIIDRPVKTNSDIFYIRWTISFRNAGTNVNTSIPCLNMSAIDVDGDDKKLREFVQTFNTTQHTYANPTTLTVSMFNTTTGMSTLAVGQVANITNIDTNAISTQINFSFGTSNSVTFKTGAYVDNDASNSQSTKDRNFSLYFKNIGTLTTLPVRLLSFSARPVSKTDVQIKWVTELEVDNKQFEIQRSFDGKNFETVAIALSFDVNGIRSYTITDKLPAGSPSKVFYRIKQIDLDYKFSISKIITINLEESNNPFVKLTPNPVVNEFSIIFENSNTPVSAIRIVDMNGREVFRNSLSGTNNNILRFDTRQANMQIPGIYIAELSFKDGSRSIQKIIKK